MNGDGVTLEEFGKIHLRVARIREAKPHPDADKLLVLTIETGSAEKQIVAGIARHYRPEDLAGRFIVVVDNLQPATLRGVVSEGMLLAAQDEQGLALVAPDRPVAPGATVR